MKNKIDEMEKNTSKTNPANFEISSMRDSILAKLDELKNESDQSHEQKPNLENNSVNQM